MTETPQPARPGRGIRPHLVPHAAVGALVLAASAARVAVAATGDDAEVAMWTAGTAFVVAVVAATTVRRRVFDKQSRRRAFAFLAAGVAWLITVSLTGLSLGAVGVLIAVGCTLSMHWWRTHPVGWVQDRTKPGRYVERWDDHIGSANGCLPGSKLGREERIPSGVRYPVFLRPGVQTLEMAQGSLSKIRGGLGVAKDQDLLIESHPTLPEPHLLLTVVTKSPIRQAVIHPGHGAFDPKTGRVALGPFADGEGVATWKAYTDNRLWGGYVQGGTGSGKSRMVESIALSLADAQTHPTVILYGDGQGGASSPLLMSRADVKARTHDEIEAMLAGLVSVILLRQDENALSGDEGFTPTKDRPGLLGIIDECHKPLSKIANPDGWARVQYLAATVAREGGKVGVALLMASQMTTLDVFGGAQTANSEAIRTNLLAGNGVMLRSKDPNAKTIFGVNVNPKKFPALAGYGLLVDEDPNGRSAPFRGYYVTDKIRVTWPERIDWRSLDPGAAAAYGPRYQRRHELAAAALDMVRRRVAARRAGRTIPEDLLQTAGTPQDGASQTAYEIQQFPTWSAMAAEAKRTLREGHKKVMGAIRRGCQSPQAIADATEYSVRQVHNLLGDLVEDGQVSRSYGKYQLIEAAA